MIKLVSSGADFGDGKIIVFIITQPCLSHCENVHVIVDCVIFDRKFLLIDRSGIQQTEVDGYESILQFLL